MHKTMIALSIVIIVGASTACATQKTTSRPSSGEHFQDSIRDKQHRGPERGNRMRLLDRNGDGRISAAEASVDSKFAEDFVQMDINRDGYVDRTDGELRMKQFRDAWFNKADTDKDGKLSKAEFDAAKPDRPMRDGSKSKMRGYRGDRYMPPPNGAFSNN